MKKEELILSKLDGLKELFEEKFKYNERAHFAMEAHLKTINGSVKKNTEFRLRATAYVVLLGIVLPAAVTYLLNRLI